MKLRLLKKSLRANGWEPLRQSKHPVWRHSASGKITTLPNIREGAEVPKGTLSAIRRQTGLELK